MHTIRNYDKRLYTWYVLKISMYDRSQNRYQSSPATLLVLATLNPCPADDAISVRSLLGWYW